MNHIKTIESFMSTFYPDLKFDLNYYQDRYYLIITNELRVNYYGFTKTTFHLENGKEFEISSSVYELLESFIPNIHEKVYFSYINPSTDCIESISKPIKVIYNFSGYTTTYTTSPYTTTITN